MLTPFTITFMLVEYETALWIFGPRPTVTAFYRTLNTVLQVRVLAQSVGVFWWPQGCSTLGGGCVLWRGGGPFSQPNSISNCPYRRSNQRRSNNSNSNNWTKLESECESEQTAQPRHPRSTIVTAIGPTWSALSFVCSEPGSTIALLPPNTLQPNQLYCDCFNDLRPTS